MNCARLRQCLKRIPPVLFVHRLVLGFPSYFRFLFYSQGTLSFRQRLGLVNRINRISRRLNCVHDEVEAMAMIRSILNVPRSVEGVIVEAGCFKGGSSAKLSLAAQLSGRQLVIFDSFEGIPDNQETHGPTGNQWGVIAFRKGDYAGSLDEVRNNIAREGEINCCEFIKGWFDETMPHFRRPIAMIFLDVDLASSTRTCLKYLYPLLQPGCVLYTHDAGITRVQEVFADEKFWQEEVGASLPRIDARLSSAMMRIYKP